ncbi:MAG: hypothetical protein HKN80_00255 [Acidimicrobiia bacterium]|nr:hypothetical protein [Acidimicrobiia bacterium]
MRAYTSSFAQPIFEWAAVDWDGPVTYDLEVDDSCAAGFVTQCGFESPEASVHGLDALSWQPADPLAINLWQPVGRRYYWRMRACAGEMCSPWTRPRHLEVGRTRGDFNGDGFSDLAVGAPLIDNGGEDQGSVFVYFGGRKGISSDNRHSQRLDDPKHKDRSSFGVSVSVAGDLNADGFADLVIGAAGTDEYRGFAYLYFGSARGLDPSPYRLGPPDGSPDDWFGASVAGAGDVDGDGFDDVIVGASGTDGTHQGMGEDLGVAHLFAGGPLGVKPMAMVSLGIGQMNFDQFGYAVTSAGDVNGDGYADIAIGSPGADQAGDRQGTDRGRVYLYIGSADGIIPVPTSRLEAPVPRDHDRFGAAVAGVGDIDGDGYGELVVGAPGTDQHTEDGGQAFVFRGGNKGLEQAPSTTLTDPSARRFQRFGSSVAGADDVNGDGFDDVLIGAASHNRGRALVYHGGREGLSVSPALAVIDPLGDGYNHFAEGVAGAGDINGDGFGDIIVGASGADNGGVFRGSAVLYPGTELGVDNTRPLRLDDPDSGSHDHFGHVVAGR